MYERILSVLMAGTFIVITSIATLYWVTRQCNVNGNFIAGPMVYECKLTGYRR